jgi:hypothetical protein
VLGLDRPLGIPVSADLAAVTAQSLPHIAIQATCSRLADAAGEILLLVRHGVSVISIAEELIYPACSSPALAEELHQTAVAHGVAVLGTGVNPGFVLDFLVIALTGIGLDYDRYTTGLLAFDYERLLADTGYNLDTAQAVQTSTGVGNTPLIELANLTALVRAVSPPGKGARLFLKDEAKNPSGSFKDRRASLRPRGEAARLSRRGRRHQRQLRRGSRFPGGQGRAALHHRAGSLRQPGHRPA